MKLKAVDHSTVIIDNDKDQSFEEIEAAAREHFFGSQSGLEIVGKGIMIHHLNYYHVSSIRSGIFVACKHNLSPIQTRKMVTEYLK